MTNTTPTQRWVLGLSALASFMVVLDMLVVATALSTIQRDLGASLEGLEWTVNAYVLSFAVLLMTGAALGDRYGRRRVFAAGLGLFAVASAGCALAPSVGVLIATRTVQGAGAALIMPLALALLNAAFPPQRRGWATGIYGGVTGLAATVGPIIGGAITQGIAWEWIFWLNVPIGLVAIPLVLARTPESFEPRSALDLPGIVLAAAAALGVVWALIRGNVAGWTSPQTLTPLAVGGVAGILFVAAERRTRAPMLPLRLFASRSFSAGNASIFFLNATLTGAIFFTAQFFQVAAGLGPLDAGLRLLPWGVMPLVLGPLAGALADRVGERSLIIAGMLAMAVGTTWMAFVAAPGVAYVWLVAPMALTGAGIALAIPAITRAVVSRVAPADLAKASGTFSTLRQLGGAFGVAALGAVFAATGGYQTAQTFGDGYVPVLALAGALALGATISGLVLPDRRTAMTPAVTATMVKWPAGIPSCSGSGRSRQEPHTRHARQPNRGRPGRHVRPRLPRPSGAPSGVMAYDVMVILEHQPGELARLGEIAGAAGVNIDGFAAFTGEGKGVVHVLIADEQLEALRDALAVAGMAVADEREVFVVRLANEPGALGEVARRLADASVNIDLAYTTFGGVRVVFGTDDVRNALAALDI